MSTDPGQAQQVLRVALVTPLVYGVAVWMGAPLPFVAAMLFVVILLLVLLALVLAGYERHPSATDAFPRDRRRDWLVRSYGTFLRSVDVEGGLSAGSRTPHQVV